MAVKVSENFRYVILDAICTTLTQLDVYDGSPAPANANAATTGTLIATIPVSWDYGNKSTASLDVSSHAAAALATGTAVYGRLANSGRTQIIQGSAGTALAADFNLDKQITTISEVVQARSCTIVQPGEV